MEISNLVIINKLQQLFKMSRTSLEKEFSPYFYHYLGRYKNPIKFNGYFTLCKYLFETTEAKNRMVLDLGCGFGMIAIFLGLLGAREVVGYDLNTEKIELFQKLLFCLGPKINNVRPFLGDSTKILYPDEYFDVVITNESISHMKEMQITIDEVYRVLKPEGRFLVRDGNNSFFLPGIIGRRRFWRKIEFGPIDPSSFRSTDIPLPFFEIRKRIILEKFPEMDSEEVELLSKETSGMYGDEIFKAVEEFEKTGKISKRPHFRYRNPITGEFPEREINPIKLKSMLNYKGFETAFKPYYCAKSLCDTEMIIKSLSYLTGKYLSILQLFLTPGFVLLGKKR